MKIQVTISEDMSSKETVSDVRKNIALEAYKSGNFSLGYCADLAGMFRADFIKFLSDNEVSIFNKEDLLNDFETIKSF